MRPIHPLQEHQSLLKGADICKLDTTRTVAVLGKVKEAGFWYIAGSLGAFVKSVTM